MAFSDAKLQTLEYVLANYKFFIPDYQRGYAWQDAQWKALWDDLLNTKNSKAQQHFTGIILLRPLVDANGVSYEVVDGQQRLITIMTLANVLRKKLHSAPVKYPLQFIDNEDLNNFFGFYTQHDQSYAVRLNRESASSYALNIEAAYNYFSANVNEIPDEDSKVLLDTLLSKFGLFVLEVTPDFDIQIAFETLNNRGRDLSKMELLKNRLIYLTTIIEHADHENPQELRKQIHSTWKQIYRWLGRIKKIKISDDEFLLAHSTAYYKRNNKAEWLKSMLFESTFSISNKELSYDYIRSYITSLESGVAWWSHIHVTDHLPRSHQKALNKLERSKDTYFKPLMLAAYMRMSESNPHMVTTPASFEEKLLPVLNLLTLMERYIVVVFRLLGKISSHERAGAYDCTYALLKAGRDGLKELVGISGMNGLEAINLIADYLKSIIHNPLTQDGNYTDPRFPWEGVFNIDAVKRAVEDRFNNNVTGYYKWEFTKLALVEYEENFHHDGNKPIKCGWDEFSFDETVEHIYPQNPNGKGAEYWKNNIPIDGRANKTEKLSKSIQNSLGNLLFLSRSDNSSVSNGPFNSKNNEPCKKSNFENSSYSATEVAKFKDWNVTTIAARGIRLLKFIEKRWSIELSKTPDSYETYLPLLFGSETEKIVSGKAGRLNEKFIKIQIV